MFETGKACWPSDTLLERVKVNMTVKDLFVFARNDVRIVLKDGFSIPFM